MVADFGDERRRRWCLFKLGVGEQKVGEVGRRREVEMGLLYGSVMESPNRGMAGPRRERGKFTSTLLAVLLLFPTPQF